MASKQIVTETRRATTCDRQGCDKRVARYMLMGWGAVGLCARHYAEEYRARQRARLGRYRVGA